MAVITVKKKPKRKPGQKAGLTRASIVAAALKLSKQGHDLNMQLIAKALGVAPAAVYAHFPSKIHEIVTEMIRTILSDVARPFHPNETWEAYLRNFFSAVHNSFHEHQNAARFLGGEIALDYYLNPLLIERILLALDLAGLPKNKQARALDLVLGSLIGLVAIECLGPVSTPKSSPIDKLDAGEHPRIMTMKDQLLKAAQERSAQIASKTPVVARTQHFADLLIAGLKAMK